MSMETATMRAMTAGGALAADLDDAIAALTGLDGDRLEEIERRVHTTLGSADFLTLVSGLAASGEDGLAALRSRRQVLGILLENTGRNLRVLERLHSREAYGGDVWVR